jgi:hypothetical protein
MATTVYVTEPYIRIEEWQIVDDAPLPADWDALNAKQKETWLWENYPDGYKDTNYEHTGGDTTVITDTQIEEA